MPQTVRTGSAPPELFCGSFFLGGMSMVIPQHVAIILDGNGRWAKSKGMPRNYGHARGAKNLEVICEDAYNMGIKYLTVYLFSTENWKRSKDEVDGLMRLFRRYTKTCIKTARENNMKVRVLGDPTAFDQDLQDSLKMLVESSKDNTGLNFRLRSITAAGMRSCVLCVKLRQTALLGSFCRRILRRAASHRISIQQKCLILIF